MLITVDRLRLKKSPTAFVKPAATAAHTAGKCLRHRQTAIG